MTLPVVWVPGHLCGAWLYAPQLAVLGGGRDTVIADTTRDDDLGAMADRLIADAPGRFVLAGLSMGGMVAMEVLARAPERVAGAVLMDTDPTRARARRRSSGAPVCWRRGSRPMSRPSSAASSATTSPSPSGWVLWPGG